MANAKNQTNALETAKNAAVVAIDIANTEMEIRANLAAAKFSEPLLAEVGSVTAVEVARMIAKRFPQLEVSIKFDKQGYISVHGKPVWAKMTMPKDVYYESEVMKITIKAQAAVAAADAYFPQYEIVRNYVDGASEVGRLTSELETLKHRYEELRHDSYRMSCGPFSFR
jgi:hypothetical protein